MLLSKELIEYLKLIRERENMKDVNNYDEIS